MAAPSRTTAHEGRPPARLDVPLESGDRLTSAEFERRYSMRPDIKRADLIEGVVYVASPMRLESHGEPQRFVSGWLAAYQAFHPEARGADGATVRLDPDNNVQPDAILLRRSGQARHTEDDYLEGAPEFVFEIAASSVSVDLGPKLRAYRRNGVREYVVWQMYENRLDWFELNEDGEYVQRQPATDGTIASHIFPGLTLNVAALLRRDLAALLETQERANRAARRRARRAPSA